MSLDFSKYYIFISHGKHEKEVFNSLDKLRNLLPEKFRWTQEITSLQCGDILIACLTDQPPHEKMTEVLGKELPVLPLIIIERKEIKDFCSSYQSGHLSSQRARMITFRDETGCQTHLVVEGFLDACKKARNDLICYTRFTIDTCLQAFTSIQVRDGIFVTHVNDFDQHAAFLQRCLKTNEKYKLYEMNGGPSVQKIFNESLKMNNKGNLTPQLHFQDSLARIPMVSMDMAEKIVEVYPNLTKLLEILQTDNGTKIIQDIKVGKNRLGPVRANRIKEYLLF